METSPKIMRGNDHVISTVRPIPKRLRSRYVLDSGVQELWGSGQVWEAVCSVEIAGGVYRDEEEVCFFRVQGPDRALQQRLVNGDLWGKRWLVGWLRSEKQWLMMTKLVARRRRD
jgi:hypothetical protein